MGELLFENSKETFVVHHRKAMSHHMVSSHFHRTYEIYYLMSGKREFFIKDRTIVIEEGDMIILSPNILHRTTNTEIPEHERFIVNIHESYLAAPDGSHTEALEPLFGKEYVYLKGSASGKAIMDPVVNSIIREVQEKKPGFERYAQALTLQLLIECCRLLSESGYSAPAPTSCKHERISEVVRFINSHYMEELSLERLAERFYISPYYLSRFFKEATGFTYVEYLNNVRIKEAMTLLLSSSMKANLIAKRVGFGSVTHFGRVFKQITGYPPSFYRKDGR
ncbi:AraC family transcriptional regulator [Paenibacillus sambharensis]|uniref:AraC family transcriptional regulator n=1 Tax=Paenibacillus sambharensis TaxID=1803190 RepID=A0A2W1LQH2_9BACL|nr:AraC family transcriptional regulator [Paenibacillus sambharensis]PZD97095.1 AraC family transcriptional regulator [Paenibacillus sambharensis]